MSIAVIGNVPLYLDEDTNEVFVEPDDAQDAPAESGFLGRRARLRRVNRRIGRLSGRAERLQGRLGYEEEPEMPAAAPADVYQAAAAAGMVNENQYNGLGAVSVPAGTDIDNPGAGFLSDTINRNLWGKSLVLNSDAPSMITVIGITVAGLPVNVGAKGAPLSMFEKDSTRFGISFGRRLALTGQTFQVNLNNIDSSAHVVSGGIIADELNPYAMQRWMEQMLLQAAVSGFQGPGY